MKNIHFFALSSGKISLMSNVTCSNCTFSIFEGADLFATSSILAKLGDQCSIWNAGNLVIGASFSSVIDCRVTSSSKVIFKSFVKIIQPAFFSGSMILQVGAALTLSSAVTMQSLIISENGKLVIESESELHIEAMIGSGIKTSFEKCPSSIAFLNVSTSGNFAWNCASSQFSRLKPSSLKCFGMAHVEFGEVQINAAVSPDKSTRFIQSENRQLQAHWTNLFNMQITAEATVASNLLFDYGNPVCYKTAALSISLFQSSSMVFKGLATLLFGVQLSMYDKSIFNVTSAVSYLQRVLVHSRMSILYGKLFVKFIPCFAFNLSIF
jgi:hypothetical protein